MFDLFYQYLTIHKKVVVPGFGTLFISRQPAHLNFEQRCFTAPVWRTSFTRSDAVADNVFISFVSRQQGVNEEEAIKNISDFTFNIKREFSVYKKLEWPKIGLLTETAQGDVEFKNDNYLFKYFPDVPAERVIRTSSDNLVFENARPLAVAEAAVAEKEISEPATKKADWWIDAIILAILAIAAIVVYYFLNGSFH